MPAERARETVLVADDEPISLDYLREALTALGAHVITARDGNEACLALARDAIDCVFTDLRMPGRDGLAVLAAAKARDRDRPVVLVTAHGTLGVATAAMRAGADDILEKPVLLDDLEMALLRARSRRRLLRQNRFLRERAAGDQLMGAGPTMRAVVALAERAAARDATVLITGESGTGKERVAALLHQRSARADGPFVKVNCAAVPEALLESEFFGHEAGAYTGANKRRAGLFELADGGTLFLDEVGDMPLPLQAKLLRVLQDGSMRRVGSLQERRVNVRVITATNRDLATEVAAHRFREDLYYRINVMSLDLPPLRARVGDITLLVNHFLGTGWHIATDALRVLETYNWPGNIRQLINVIERAKILADDQFITTDELPAAVLRPTTAISAAGTISSVSVTLPADDGTLAAIEKTRVVEVMQKQKGNKSRAAQVLGITRRSLYRLLEKYELDGGSTQTTGHDE